MTQNNKATDNETRISNILLYGTPAAKCEILVQLIYLGNPDILARVLNAMSDAEYQRVVPTS